MPITLTPALGLALAALLLSALTAFVLALDEVSLILQARSWLRAVGFVLGLLAGIAIVVLVARRSGWL